MLVQRRLLPSISSLVALEAVDRLGSASAAAIELSLTHSAISRQIKVLEGQLGTQLVVRKGIRLSLTPAAKDYCLTIRESLRQISRASVKLKANPNGGRLDLAILPTFGMHWLAPKLRQFAMTYPEVTLNLSSRLEPFEFAREEFDAAIHYGATDWPGVQYLPIMDEYVLPVCAPALAATLSGSPQVLMTLPLLHLETRPDAWSEWFSQQGIQAGSIPGMVLDQFSSMAHAAIHQLGVALLPVYLAQSEIALGRLVPAHHVPLRASGRYYLVWPEAPSPRPPLRKFIDWLRTVVEIPDSTDVQHESITGS